MWTSAIDRKVCEKTKDHDRTNQSTVDEGPLYRGALAASHARGISGRDQFADLVGLGPHHALGVVVGKVIISIPCLTILPPNDVAEL